jgi:hypothetical protein
MIIRVACISGADPQHPRLNPEAYGFAIIFVAATALLVWLLFEAPRLMLERLRRFGGQETPGHCVPEADSYEVRYVREYDEL